MGPGHRLWIAAMRHLLTGIANRLCGYRWSIALPHGDAECPLTDHPVLRLNYNSPSQYDFEGGWGSPGTEIMMPVSPKHLLYVQVGRKHSNRLTFSSNQTHLVQRFLVERAHRWVFASQPEEWISKARPRHVDLEFFAAEEKEWDEFHPDQMRAEMSSAKRDKAESDE